MGAGRLTAPAAPGSRRVSRRILLIAGAMLALALAAFLVAVLSAGGEESPRYDDPAEMLAIARDAGLQCEEWRFGTLGSELSGEQRTACVVGGVERPSNTITFLVAGSEHTVPTRIDNRSAPDSRPVRAGDRWIVGDFWMVEIERGLVPDRLVERIADRLGGDVKRW
jgi:hypothetical protein